MDRFKKRLEDFRLKVRKFVTHNWHNDPEGDVFRSLDAMFVMAAIRYKPTQKWKRICWNTYCVIAVCNFLISVANLVEEISGKFDVVKATWHGTFVSTAALCFVKGSILNQHFESIETARSFINSKPFESGDTWVDSARRKKFFQWLQLMVLLAFGMLLINQIILMVPNTGADELYGKPQILQHLGSPIAGVIYALYICTTCPIWFNKYCVGTGTICSLLYGFQIEYEIFVRGFETVLDNVYSDVEDMLPSSLKNAPEWKHRQRDLLFWKCLKKRLNDQMKLHIELVEKLQLLQPIVKKYFGIIFYNTMVIFSPLFYVVLFNGYSVTSFLLLTGVVVNLLECYGFCSFIESLQDVNDSLEVEIMDLITKIPHSKTNHEHYSDVRSTLFIMKTFVRNSGQFSCGGVFPITGEVCTVLLNTGYTVLTFLLDVGKKG